MSKLIDAGNRLAELKIEKDRTFALAYAEAARRIAEYEFGISDEWEDLIDTVKNHLQSPEPTVKDEARRILKLYRHDGRNQNNPLKNINIGVDLSFRHKGVAGKAPRTARRLVIERIVKKAIKNGIHSKDCKCGGATDGCNLNIKVTNEDNLPEQVTAQIEKSYKKYKENWKGEEEETFNAI